MAPKVNGKASGVGRDNILGFRTQNVLNFIAFAAVMIYVMFYAPTQAWKLDLFYLKKMALLTRKGPPVNNITYGVIWLLTVSPGILASVMIPAARSKNGVPIWPFTMLSYGMGAYGILGYFVFYVPGQQIQNPPPKQEVAHKRLFRLTESVYAPLISLYLALIFLSYILFPTLEIYEEFLVLMSTSWLTHVGTIDLVLQQAMIIYWMNVDAYQRKYRQKVAMYLFSAVPLVGPCLYLLVRPKTMEISDKKLE